jgi:hypothetical protein
LVRRLKYGQLLQAAVVAVALVLLAVTPLLAVAEAESSGVGSLLQQV